MIELKGEEEAVGVLALVPSFRVTCIVSILIVCFTFISVLSQVWNEISHSSWTLLN